MKRSPSVLCVMLHVQLSPSRSEHAHVHCPYVSRCEQNPCRLVSMCDTGQETCVRFVQNELKLGGSKNLKFLFWPKQLSEYI